MIGAMRRLKTLPCLLLLAPALARADVAGVEVHRREPFAGGVSFGDVGSYEKISGVVRFAVDPLHARNRGIVDLELAPRNAEGKVEFESDFLVLAPKDLSKGNGALLYEVNNRGNLLALRAFGGAAAGNDPNDAGDGWFFRRGWTLVWSGWIGELLPGEGRFLLRPPPALEDGKPLRGIVRYEMATNVPAESLPLSRREGLGSYPPTARGEETGVLTWRMRETDPRIPIPRAQWSLERRPPPKVERGVSATLGQVRLRLAGGFRPGHLYELVCEAEGAVVHGVGYLGVRDLVSQLRRRGPNSFLAAGFSRAHAFGISQSGRFLRNFVHLDLNEDEGGRRVFDGLMPHVAGGGLGFFHQRFCQPSRYNGQHEEHLFPCDRFPFAYGDEKDPFSGRTDGILRPTRERRPEMLPRIFHTQNASEYWHRSGSLVHTDPEGKRDAEIPANVRIFSFGGTQHGATHNPVPHVEAPPNPADSRPFLKALLDALDAWVKGGTEPPASVYPRIDRGTLVPPTREASGFPAIPGVRYPEVIQRPHGLDWGPEFESKGRISVEPPRKLGDYVVLVPASDGDGNDRGTLNLPEILSPLATYTGWNLRARDSGAETMLAELMGAKIPFPRTRADREKSGDPRLSVEERHPSFDAYLARCRAACEALIAGRHLLREDADAFLAGRRAAWDSGR